MHTHTHKQTHNPLWKQNSFSISLAMLMLVCICVCTTLGHRKKEYPRAIINLFEQWDATGSTHYICIGYICAIDLVGVVFHCFVAYFFVMYDIIVSYIRVCVYSWLYVYRLWICTNSSQCVVLSFFFFSENISAHWIVAPPPRRPHRRHNHRLFASVRRTRKKYQPTSSFDFDCTFALNFMLWLFRYYRCEFIQVYMHFVCLFVCFCSSHFIFLPWLPILFPLCVTHQYILTAHTHILNVTLKHIHSLFHTPSSNGVKCACGSLACVQAAWQYALVYHCMDDVWMLFVCKATTAKFKWTYWKRVRSTCQVKSVCKSNLKIILSR